MVAYIIITVAADVPSLNLTVAAGKELSKVVMTDMLQTGAAGTLYNVKAVIAAVPANAVTGAYDFGTFLSLSAGNHVLIARATDAVGNLGKIFLSQTVVVAQDKTARTVTLQGADGTKNFYRDDVVGKAYAFEHIKYAANRVMIYTARYLSNDTITYRNRFERR